MTLYLCQAGKVLESAIRLSELMGKAVWTFIPESAISKGEAGVLNWSPATLPSGSYLLVLTAGGESLSVMISI